MRPQRLSRPARTRISTLRPFRAAGTPQRQRLEHANAVDRRGRRGPQEARSRGKERKPHLRGARRRVPKRRHRQGEPDRDQTQRRRARRRARRRVQPARLGPNGRLLITLGPVPTRHAPARPPLAISRSRRGTAGAAGRSFGVGRDRRDAAAAVRGHSRIRLPVAARRSEKRRLRLLRAHAGRRASPIAPAIAGWPIGRRRRDRCAGAARAPRHREFMAVVVRRRAASMRRLAPLLEHADQAWSVRARFAPRRRGLDEERPQARLPRCRLDIGPAVRKPHRRLELESVALASFDREREQPIRRPAPSPRRRTEARGRRHRRARPRRR